MLMRTPREGRVEKHPYHPSLPEFCFARPSSFSSAPLAGSSPMSHEPSWALLPQTPLSADNDPALMSSRGTGYSPLI